MKIGVIKEIEFGERRVALIPEVVARLTKSGLEVLVESHAGELSFFADSTYLDAGAQIYTDKLALINDADILLKVGAPREEEVNMFRSGQIAIGFLNPLGRPELMRRLAHQGVTAMSMEMIPRSSRAQSMDALSSQASIAGYKAVLIAAAALPKYLPMLTTAAGTIPPAKVVVLGAGVAGLQAIATARRLGAQVEAYDIRPAVREEVQSLGAKFIDVTLDEDTTAAGGYAKEISEAAKQHAQAVLAKHIKDADIVITTAQVPGRKAPVMVSDAMIAQMKRGSVIVDMAGEQGGNCEGTIAGKDVVCHGATIISPINLPSSMPIHASQKYAKNLLNLLNHLIKKGELQLDFTDDIISSACITHSGEVLNQRVRDALTQLAIA
ncbi:MAG: Re/Si-specific NAD(P)(+) transhydrogenase subunit alpha [Pseudanabaenaceae cyanobacterium bins.39]|nr:Re/Si-specific NAD(P)(+) transhydrogenase subunit alpha [Pseudanabaenaceae cyanobacterium bins.39]